MSVITLNNDWESIPTGDDFDAVITLVHGTWGRKGELGHGASPFCQRLNAALGGRTAFRAYRWSGKNRHAERIIAARGLRRCVYEGIAQFPNARHYVIAHSHGGNVAAYALNDPTLAMRVAGLITLATPFVHVERRPLIDAVVSMAHFSYKLAPWVPRAGIAAAILTIFIISDWRNIWMLRATLLSFLLGAWVLWSKVRGNADQFEKVFAPDLTLPIQIPTPTLIVTATADEASNVLGLSSLLAWASSRALGFVASVTDRFGSERLLLFLAYAFILPVMLGPLVAVWPDLRKPLSAVESIVLRLIFFLIILCLLALILRLIAVPLATLLCWLSSRMFGPENGFWSSLEWRISAGTTPPGGSWECYNVVNDSSKTGRTRAWEWMHFKPYTDPHTIDFISKWVLGQNKKQPD